jgi:MAF protein
MQLVLASSSPYRKQLLERLSVPFSSQSPDIDESALVNETPSDTVLRLAQEKAEALRQTFPEHLIIGSDQIAVHANTLINKPGDYGNACLQLQRFSGQSVHFLTALCVLNTLDKKLSSAVIPTEVQFRKLRDAEIAQYLSHEQPYDCAGSFKAEGLGIALFEKISSDDPTAIIGLPLIKLSQMLTEHSYEIFDNLI